MNDQYNADTIHGDLSQSERDDVMQRFRNRHLQILVATDVMARGLDLDEISHVINFDTPNYPENYMHRIGRTGRAEHEGKSLLFSTEKEQDAKNAIEALMDYTIPLLDFPEEVEKSDQLTPEERPKIKEHYNPHKRETDEYAPGPAFHEKSEKNSKTNHKT